MGKFDVIKVAPRRLNLRSIVREVVTVLLAPLWLWAGAGAAFAVTDWGADELAQLQSGAAVVRVTEAERPADGEVRAAIDIPAPRTAVWSVLYDCEGAPAFMKNMKSCTVLQQGRGWDIREHQVQWTTFLPSVRSVFRSEYIEGQRIVFSRTEGDLRYLEGSWRLEPLAGGKATRIHYEARVGFNSLVPGFLVRGALLKDIPEFLGVIRNEVLRRAPAAAAR